MYCHKNGNNTPEEQLKIDEKQWPGGVMCGYVLWINEKLKEFRKISPDSFIGFNLSDQKEFDNFLLRL